MHIACKLHNICIDDFGTRKPDTLNHGTVSNFSGEGDYEADD